MKKSTRTISGITPVAVMARPAPCPGRCIYCPTYPEAPRSYTPESPAVIRARKFDYDARKQVEFRLKMLEDMGHPTDKIELIIMGGTFLAQEHDYQYQFVKECYDALNGTHSADLEEAKRLNEKARHRCTGLCIETRPDWCGQAEVDRMLEFGTTRVELGVQTLDDEVYRLVRRGHTVEEVVRATALLREHAVKVHYHWMPGLPGLAPERELALFRMLFDDPRFRPDGLKLYPTMVVPGTELERWYREERYQPYDDETMLGLMGSFKSLVPEYVRISRVLRDIPSKYIVGGLKDSVRDVVRERMREKGLACRCIRCREYGHRVKEGFTPGEPHLARLDYQASEGKEVFLSYEDEGETLFGLLRLRIPSGTVPSIAEHAGSRYALVRELHVYGPEVSLGEQEETSPQHKGLGKALLAEAERIASAEFGAGNLVILSGVGAREYYAELGYRPAGHYMVKRLLSPLP